MLFNGGALTPALIRDRLRELLASWNGGRAAGRAGERRPRPRRRARRGLLRPGAARARRAHRRRQRRAPTTSALARRPRSGARTTVDTPSVPGARAACRKARRSRSPSRRSTVLANQPVSFPALCLEHAPAATRGRRGVRADARLAHRAAADPHRAALRQEARGAPACRCTCVAQLTEVGTLEVWCRSLHHRAPLAAAVPACATSCAPAEDDEARREPAAESVVERRAAERRRSTLSRRLSAAAERAAAAIRCA